MTTTLTLVLLAAVAAGPAEKVAYHEGFESGEPNWTIWAKNADQHSFTHIWNDFDNDRYRDHVTAYPTVDGVIDTLQWDGYREGVDDTRYLATLLAAIRSAAPEKKPIARAAQKWLGELEVSGHLDAIRTAMIDWILKLR